MPKAEPLSLSSNHKKNLPLRGPKPVNGRIDGVGPKKRWTNKKAIEEDQNIWRVE